MPDGFGTKLRRVRLGKVTATGKRFSQFDAAVLFNVSLSTYANWEHEPPRTFPDSRSREKILELWPEVFEAVRNVDVNVTSM
jgi:hypothetical protein